MQGVSGENRVYIAPLSRDAAADGPFPADPVGLPSKRIYRRDSALGYFSNKELADNNLQIVVAPVDARIPEHCPVNSHRLGRWWSIPWLCQSGSYYGSILKQTGDGCVGGFY